jgi:hypothetical protein
VESDRRSVERVQFDNGYTARIVALDGSWERACRVGDVSDTGAKITIDGPIVGIDLREFFLKLTPTGSAVRRCERIWLNGDEAGVRFVKE